MEDNPVTPERRYHFTSAIGMKSILTGGQIWATDIRYLNDSTEFEYLFDLWRSVMPLPAELESLYDRLRSIIFDSFRTYVACFCECGDLLSQWRGYAGGSGGYAIGFKWNELKVARTGSWHFERILYREEEQIAIIKDILVQVAQASFDGKAFDQLSEQEIRSLALSMAGVSHVRLGLIAPTLKAPGFREEAEWRAILSSEKTFVDEIQFRDTAIGLTPFVNLDITDPETGRPLVDTIIIGPTPHQTLAESAVRTLLRKLGFGEEDVSVEHSAIPLRP